MQQFWAVYINLDRDVARREHMKQQLASAGIKASRQAGICGTDLPADLALLFFDADGRAKTNLKAGEIGCYASHIRVLQKIASGEIGQPALVMEDDLALNQGFCAILDDVIDNLPQGWGVVRLSNPPRRAYAPTVRFGGGHHLVRYSKIPMSAAAYLINREAARKFLDQGFRGFPIDIDLARPWIHNLKTYGVWPSLALPGVLASTIDALDLRKDQKVISPSIDRLRMDYLFALPTRWLWNAKDLGLFRWVACIAINLVDAAARSVLRKSIIHAAAKVFPVRHARLSGRQGPCS